MMCVEPGYDHKVLEMYLIIRQVPSAQILINDFTKPLPTQCYETFVKLLKLKNRG